MLLPQYQWTQSTGVCAHVVISMLLNKLSFLILPCLYQVVTPSPFLLSAHYLSELRISLKTLAMGNSYTVVTATGIVCV